MALLELYKAKRDWFLWLAHTFRNGLLLFDEMTVKNLSLTHLIRPAKNENANAPVLFLLHGYGSDEQDLFSFAPELPEDLWVISVRAPHILEPYGYAWYSINFEAERGKWSNIEQAVASRDAILKFIEEAVQSYRLDPMRISLLGFSQGAILGYALALSYPEHFRSLIALSGYIDAKMLASDYLTKSHTALSIYASHGQLDVVIPPVWAEHSADLMQEMKLNYIFEQFPVGHGVSAENFHSFRRWMEGKY